MTQAAKTQMVKVVRWLRWFLFPSYSSKRGRRLSLLLVILPALAVPFLRENDHTQGWLWTGLISYVVAILVIGAMWLRNW